MQRVDTSTAVDVLADPAPLGTPGYFSAGNPVTGQPATVPGRDWFNMVQEEVANVIEGAGIALDKTDRTQLRAAIQQMIASGAHAVIISNATFAAGVVDGNAVRWDAGNNRFDKALADGTASDRAVGVADVTNSEVVAFGETRAGLFAGLTPGERYYLDGAAAGGLILVAPTDRVMMGVAKAATVFFVDIDYLGAPPVLQGKFVLTIPATYIRPRVSNGAGALATLEAAVNKGNLPYIPFDPASQEYGQFTWAFPKSWDGGTIEWRYGWSHPAAVTNFGITLSLAGLSLANDDAVDTAFGAAVNVSDTGGTTDDLYWSDWSAAVAIAGAGSEEGQVFQLSRVVADAGDTLGVDARVHYVQLRINLDKGNDA